MSWIISPNLKLTVVVQNLQWWHEHSESINTWLESENIRTNGDRWDSIVLRLYFYAPEQLTYFALRWPA